MRQLPLGDHHHDGGEYRFRFSEQQALAGDGYDAPVRAEALRCSVWLTLSPFCCLPPRRQVSVPAPASVVNCVIQLSAPGLRRRYLFRRSHASVFLPGDILRLLQRRR